MKHLDEEDAATRANAKVGVQIEVTPVIRTLQRTVRSKCADPPRFLKIQGIVVPKTVDCTDGMDTHKIVISVRIYLSECFDTWIDLDRVQNLTFEPLFNARKDENVPSVPWYCVWIPVEDGKLLLTGLKRQDAGSATDTSCETGETEACTLVVQRAYTVRDDACIGEFASTCGTPYGSETATQPSTRRSGRGTSSIVQQGMRSAREQRLQMGWPSGGFGTQNDLPGRDGRPRGTRTDASPFGTGPRWDILTTDPNV